MGRYNERHERRVEPSKFSRFCPNCGRVSYAWQCCGQRTRAVSMRETVGDKV